MPLPTADLPRRRGPRLGPQAAEASWESARARGRRLARRLVFIVQCGLGAAAAWWIADDLLHHPMPFFAPVTAMITLGMSYGQRLRRVADVMLGVAVGVLIGDLFVHYLGSGLWQLAVVVVVAMSLATLLGAGVLLTTQAGVQAVIVTTLVAGPGQAFSRWLDAVIGASLALALTVVAPTAPVNRPREQAAAAVRELSGILAATAQALRDHDADAARAVLERARGSERMLTELRAAADEGIAVVRLSPLRRRDLPGVQAIADLLEPLDRAIRNVRVVARRASVATWREERVPAAYIALLTSLAEVTADIADELRERRLPAGARPGLVAVAELSAVIDPSAQLSAEVLRAQIRSMVVDLLMLTGLSYEDARELVAESMSSEDPRDPGATR